MKLAPKIQPDETERKPVCAFCDSTDVRGMYGPSAPIPEEYICEECFSHELMCWDDLPEAGK